MMLLIGLVIGLITGLILGRFSQDNEVMARMDIDEAIRLCTAINDVYLSKTEKMAINVVVRYAEQRRHEEDDLR